MNFFSKFMLRVVFLGQPFYQKLGVNTAQLRSILRTKLIMDDRRPNSLVNPSKSKKTERPAKATLGMMVIALLLGCLYLLAFAVGANLVTSLTLFYTIFIFMLASTLISDFTSVLIDVRDNYIILPKPVNDKTVVLARLLHILIHISKLVIPMSLPSAIAVAIRSGLVGLVAFLVLLTFSTLFTLFLINAVYILILKLTTPERFKSIINYFQIIFAIILYASYQLVPRMIGPGQMDSFDITKKSFAIFLPPYWFAGAWQFLTNYNREGNFLFCTFLAVLVPLLCIWLVIRFFAPAFNRKLSMISGSEGSAGPSPSKEKATRKTWSGKLAVLFTRNAAEQTGFLFTWKMSGRSRDFKLRVYPMFGYVVVFFVILFMRNGKYDFTDLHGDSSSVKVIVLSMVYFGSLVVISALHHALFSEKYKAAWFFYSTPLPRPGMLLHGSILSIMIKFYLPIGMLMGGFALATASWLALPNILLGLSNQVLICYTIGYLHFRHFPFSRSPEEIKSGSFVRNLVTMIVPITIAIVHALLYSFFWPVIIILALSLTAVLLLRSSIRAKGWEFLKPGV